MRKEIKAHIFDLFKVFGREINYNQLARLCEIEVDGHSMAEDYCNGKIESEEYEKNERQLLIEVSNIFCDTENIIHLNSDPRGHFIKIDDEYLRNNKDLDIEKDWGGYGIVCPEWLLEIVLEGPNK